LLGRKVPLFAIVALAVLAAGVALLAPSCHRGSDARFHTETTLDLAAEYSTNPSVRMEPDVPTLRQVPVFFVNQEVRKVVRLRQGMRVVFPALPIREDARLVLGAAVDPAAWALPASATRLSISAGGEEIASVELRPVDRVEDRAWRDLADVDLARFAGREIDLEMRAAGLGHPDDPNVLAGFANPLLLSAGTAHEDEDALVVLDSIQTDLVASFRPEWGSGGAARTDAFENFQTGKVEVDTGKGGPLVEAPPGSKVAATVTLPAGAALDLEFGALAKVGRARHPDATPQASGDVEFVVTVAGMERLRERVPLGEASLQRMHSKRVRVSGGATGPVAIALETRWADGGTGFAPLYWSRAAIVRERTVKREDSSESATNVLFVLVDTLRADHLGCYGYARRTSPNVDRLAAEGRVFRRCTAASSWTVPSTTTLLTGVPPLEHGAIGYDRARIADDVVNGAERFHERGFTTAAFVTNPWITRTAGYGRGFDEFQSIVGLRAEDVNRAFANWLDHNEGLRFFAYLHYFDPHQPYGAPGAWLNRFASAGAAARLGPTMAAQVERFNNALQQGQLLGFTPEETEYVQALYDGEIAYFDDCFGKLVDDLRDRGILDRTLIVFTSDHGEAFFEHGFLGHEFDVSEETVHVPLVLWRPGRIAPGASDAPVGSEDVLPTIGALAGIPIGGHDALSGDDDPERPLFATTEQGLGELRDADSFKQRVRISAIRRGDRKLWRVDGRKPDDPPALRYFRLDSDPGERTDASGSEPEVEKDLGRRLDDWIRRTLSKQRPIRGILDEERRRQLKALGYIGG
jgi:arylsulfatase A-like enzyme